MTLSETHHQPTNVNARPTTIPSARQAYLCLLAAALVNLFVNTRWNIALAVWIAGVLFLRFFRIQRLRGQKAWQSYLLLGLATGVSAGIGLYGIIPAVVFYPTIISVVLLSALSYLVDRWLYHRLPGFSSTLVFPLAATALEFANLASSPLGSWGASAYTQSGSLVLMQLVSLTGIWGIALLINWFASVVNWAWEAGFHWPTIRRGVLIYTSVLLAALVYGGARLAFAPLTSGTLRVAGIAHELDIQRAGALFSAEDRQAMQQFSQAQQERYFASSLNEAQAGAEVILWSESAVWVQEADEPALMERAAQFARQEQVYLAMSMITLYTDATRPAANKLVVIDPNGQTVMTHLKYGGNFLEGTEAGDGILRSFDTPAGKLSGVICWDADFIATLRQVGRSRTGLLLIPARDWREIDPMHSDMAVFRAIENGTSIFRLAEQGLSLGIDPYGRVIGRMDYFTASQRVLLAQMPTRSVFTLYPLIGDLFAWLSAAGTLLLLAWGIAQRWRKPKEK